MNKFFRRILSFLGINSSTFAMLAMVVMVGMGERVAERFVPVYLLALGASSLMPGFLNAANNALSALYGYPAGWLADRIGYKRALLVLNLLPALGFAIVVAFPSWISLVIGSFFYLSWSAISLPATMSLISTVLPKQKHAMGVSLHSLVRRIPMALGPLLGGILIDSFGIVQGVRIAFGISLGLTILAIVFQQIFITNEPAKSTVDKCDLSFWKVAKSFPRELRVLLVSDILIRFCEQIPYAYMALWAMEHTQGARVGARDFGILTVVEMGVAMVIYIPAAILAERFGSKKIVFATFVFFTMFPLVLLVSRSFEWLLLAYVVRGFKEFGEPTRKALILDLSHEQAKAASFGAYYLFRDVVVAIAALFSGFLWRISPALNFSVAFAFGVMGALVFFFFGSTRKHS